MQERHKSPESNHKVSKHRAHFERAGISKRETSPTTFSPTCSPFDDERSSGHPMRPFRAQWGQWGNLILGALKSHHRYAPTLFGTIFGVKHSLIPFGFRGLASHSTIQLHDHGRNFADTLIHNLILPGGWANLGPPKASETDFRALKLLQSQFRCHRVVKALPGHARTGHPATPPP